MMDKEDMPFVHIRALEPEDVDFLYEMENDINVWTAGGNNVPYSRSLLLEYITRSTGDIYADKQVRLVVENKNGQRVGLIDLFNFDPCHRRAELGILIAGAQRRKGLAMAAVIKMLDYAKRVVRLHQVYAIVAEDNKPCVGLLQGVGFQGDVVLNDWLLEDGKYKPALFLQIFL